MSVRDKQFYQRELIDNKKSVSEIAREQGVYTNKIRREATKLGFKLRGRSETQKLLLESGKKEHPTKGKVRSDEEKVAISESTYRYWSEASDEVKEKKRQQSKEHWDSLSPLTKERIQKSATDAARGASKTGSKIERFLGEALAKDGKVVQVHLTHKLMNENLEIDLFLPQLGIAIEVDGPSHFDPVWGEESLKRQQKADTEKNGLLLVRGLAVIRVQIKTKNESVKLKRDIAKALLELVNSGPTGLNILEVGLDNGITKS